MSYNNGYYHGHAEAGYPGHPPYGPPPYYHTPPPSYAAPTGYPPGPLPPPTYPGYSPRYPPSQNGPYYPPPMPYQSPGGGWPNQGPRHFNGHNNRGRQNFRQPFNGHQQNWNDNSGRKRKYDSYGSQIENDKKQKADKRDLPENNKFSCDTCNRGFKSEEQYKIHVDAHVKCRFEGCEFVAHEKLVNMHVEHVHLSGYASKLESAKNIEEWKEERKRNYPTKENIAKKEKERQEAIERGEFVGRRGRGRGKFGNNWIDRRKQRFQGRGHFPPQDLQQGGQDWPETEVKANATEAPCNFPTILPEEVEKTAVQTDSSALPERTVSETQLISDDAPEEFPSHLEKPETCQTTMNIPSESTIPEGDNAKVKPTEAELLSNHGRAEKNRPQRHEGFQKRVGQRREPLSKKLVERDIKHEMTVMLQVAAFFATKFQEKKQSEDQGQISSEVI